MCHANPNERSRFIRCIYNLLNSSSNAVRYEAAGTLLTLSSAPTATKAAASCYIELIVKESDNNVKLIVLDRLIAIKENEQTERVMQDLVMDVLRVLAAPDIEVRRKTLNLAMDLVSSRNIEEMVLVLKKEIAKTHNVEHEDTGKYRQLLVKTLHSCCIRVSNSNKEKNELDSLKKLQNIWKMVERWRNNCSIQFPDVAATVIPVLSEFLSDTNEQAATDVLVFIREAIQKFPHLRVLITEKLIETFPAIRSVKVHQAALWILGEYITTINGINEVIEVVNQSIGEMPIVDAEQRRLAGEAEVESETSAVTPAAAASSKVTSDGTYATQSAFSVAQWVHFSNFSLSSCLNIRKWVEQKRLTENFIYRVVKKEERPPLRQYLMDGDYFIATTLASTLTKLALKYADLEADPSKQNRLFGSIMLTMSSILHLGRSGLSTKSITNDDADRIFVCLRTLSTRTPELVSIFKTLCRDALAKMLDAHQNQEEQIQKEKQAKAVKIQVDDPVAFSQLSSGRDNMLGENVFESSLNQALAGTKSSSILDVASPNSKLNKVTQLTGFSDPVYAEAYVHVNQYDIVLDVLVVNQTNDTLQNCTLELATLGDLKLVERPHPVVLAPHDFCNIKANVKVSSTENGIIFGNIGELHSVK